MSGSNVCLDCGRSFPSLRALHAHESLTEVPKLADRLCKELPGQCVPNWITGKCETHTAEARRIIRAGQRLRYTETGKEIPRPLRIPRRVPAMVRLIQAMEA